MVKISTGYVSNHLRVVCDTGKRTTTKCIVWKCLCDPQLGGCGKFVELGTRSLTRYHIGHCGCKDSIPELCTKCGKNPPKSKVRGRRGFWCKDCHSAYNVEWDASNPERRILINARSRAKKSGRVFSLCLSDITIPERCPVLGIPLRKQIGRVPQPDSPSIDCIIPSLGYIPSNVKVISFRANQLKNDGSSEEHEAIAKYIRQMTKTLVVGAQ